MRALCRIPMLLTIALCARGQVLYTSRVYKPSGRTWQEIWRLDLVTGKARPLTTAARPHLRLSCGKDGQILFTTTSQPLDDYGTEVWAFDPRTGAERYLRPAGAVIETSVRAPARAPDGKRLARYSADQQQLVVLDTRTNKELMRAALPLKSEQWSAPLAISWSPDGSKLVVLGNAGSSTAHYLDMWLLNAKSRTWSYLDGGNDPTWSPDGRRLFYTTPRGLAPVPGGKHQVWVSELRVIEFPPAAAHAGGRIELQCVALLVWRSREGGNERSGARQPDEAIAKPPLTGTIASWFAQKQCSIRGRQRDKTPRRPWRSFPRRSSIFGLFPR